MFIALLYLKTGMSASFIFHQECINMNLNEKGGGEFPRTVINKNLKMGTFKCLHTNYPTRIAFVVNSTACLPICYRNRKSQKAASICASPPTDPS